MFNEGISAFIKRYKGSRREAALALGCSSVVLGQMLRGEMKVPLLRAFLIEELSKGAIPVCAVIQSQEPALAKAIEKSRHIQCQRVAKQKHYSLPKFSMMGIRPKSNFPFAHYDYPMKNNLNLPKVIMSQTRQLIYGKHRLDQAAAQNKLIVNVLVVNLEELIKPNYFELPLELTLVERVVIGITLEHIISNRDILYFRAKRQEKSEDELGKRDNQQPVSIDTLQKFIQWCSDNDREPTQELIHRVDVESALVYRQVNKILEKGIIELRYGLDRAAIDIDSALKIANLPHDKQRAALEKHMSQPA